jgi:hypothetical protein
MFKKKPNRKDAPVPDGDPFQKLHRIDVGMLKDNVDLRDFTAEMTQGAYVIPGDLAHVAIVPGVLEGGRAGVLFTITRKVDDQTPARIEVGRVTFEGLLMVLVNVMQIMHEHKILDKENVGGAFSAYMAAHEQASKIRH